MVSIAATSGAATRVTRSGACQRTPPSAPSLSATWQPRSRTTRAASSRSLRPVSASSSAALGSSTSVWSSRRSMPAHARAGSQLVSTDVVAPAWRARAKTPGRCSRQARQQEEGRTVEMAHRRHQVLVDDLGAARGDGPGEGEDRAVSARQHHAEARRDGRVCPKPAGVHAALAEGVPDEGAVHVVPDGRCERGRYAETGETARHDRRRTAEHEVGRVHQRLGLSERGDDVPGEHQVRVGIPDDQDVRCRHVAPPVRRLREWTPILART